MTGTVSAQLLCNLPKRLRAAQPLFEMTGGLHGCGLFDQEGNLLELCEDVGRHNALDKLIGRLLKRQALPATDRILVLSGRASFELIQKALFAGIPMVAAVGAPSSLAISLAEESGMTLVGFLKADRFNIYTLADRGH